MSRSLGISPFEVLHGYLLRINAHEQFIEGLQERVWTPAAEIQAEIRGSLEESQDRYKRYSNMRKGIHRRYHFRKEIASTERSANQAAEEIQGSDDHFQGSSQ